MQLSFSKAGREMNEKLMALPFLRYAGDRSWISGGLQREGESGNWVSFFLCLRRRAVCSCKDTAGSINNVTFPPVVAGMFAAATNIAAVLLQKNVQYSVLIIILLSNALWVCTPHQYLLTFLRSFLAKKKKSPYFKPPKDSMWIRSWFWIRCSAEPQRTLPASRTCLFWMCLHNLVMS